MSSGGLTEEQKRRIEENKKKALAKRADKLSPVKQVQNSTSWNKVQTVTSRHYGGGLAVSPSDRNQQGTITANYSPQTSDQEQKRRIEENKKKALAKRAEKLSPVKQVQDSTSWNKIETVTSGQYVGAAVSPGGSNQQGTITANYSPQTSDQEQKRRIEENKKKALARRAEKLSPVKPDLNSTSCNFPHTVTSGQNGKTVGGVVVPPSDRTQQGTITPNFSQQTSGQYRKPGGTVVPPCDRTQQGTITPNFRQQTSGQYGKPGGTVLPPGGNNQQRTITPNFSQQTSSQNGKPGHTVEPPGGNNQQRTITPTSPIKLDKNPPNTVIPPFTKNQNGSQQGAGNSIWLSKSFGLSTHGTKPFMSDVNKSMTPGQFSVTQVAKIVASSQSGSSGTNIFNMGKNKPVRGRCVLISRERFDVDVGFSAPLVEVFKSMNTKLYDAVTKNWSFKLEDYNRFMSAIKDLQPMVNIEALPKQVLQIFAAQLKGNNSKVTIPSVDLSKVDQQLVDALMPFQRTGVDQPKGLYQSGVLPRASIIHPALSGFGKRTHQQSQVIVVRTAEERFGIHKNGRILIADDMGLGKTIQAICLTCYYRDEWPLLIVVPSSVRFDWAQQIRRWLPSIDPQEIFVPVTGKEVSTTYLVNIFSYDLMAKKAEYLQKQHFQVVIMDECHLLKNFKTARCKAAMPLLQNSHRVILLSGTPALSRPSELYTSIQAVCPFLFKFHDFGVRYCDGKKMHFGWDFSGSSNMNELQIILEERIMIRRLKKDVLKQLPSKMRQMVLLDPSSIRINKEMKTGCKAMTVKSLKGMERRGVLLEYFHHTGAAKIPAVRDYVVDLIEMDRKFLIFAHHQEVLDAIEDVVKAKLAKNYIRIDGRTAAEQRNHFCKKFQQNDDYRVAVLSITAANAGLNLSAANLVVFAELFWNPGILVQAEDRVHRIGQQDMVSIHYLVSQGTADDYIWPLVQKKLDVLNKAGLSKDNFSEADTTRVKDRKQSDLSEFFEKSFMEDEVPEGKESNAGVESQTEIPATKSAAREAPATPTKKQSSIFSYFNSSEASGLHGQSESRTTSTVKQEEEMPNDDLHLMLGEVDWEDDFDEPHSKKPKFR